MDVAPKKVLIIEDEPQMRELLRDAFARSHYVVLEANNGKDALELALGNHPHLIILDLMIPEMDGMSILSNLRKDAWGKKVPVIVLTNLSADEGIMQGLIKNEPSYYLIKADSTLEDILEKAKITLNQNI